MTDIKKDQTLVCVHIIENYSEYENKIPENSGYKFPDNRCTQPFIFHNKKADQLVYLVKTIDLKIEERNVCFSLPNEIGISLNIYLEACKSAQKLKEELKVIIKEQKDVYDNKIKLLYDYIEQIQIALIFSYRALESFCNSIIPQDFIYKKKNSKGIEESYGVLEIERWIPTSEKLINIVPQILNCEAPKQKKFWSFFKELEKLRNEVIHSKKSNSVEITKNLLSNNIIEILNSSLDVLNYYLEQDISNEAFPLGFVKQGFKLHLIDNPDEVFQWLDKE
ncbi:hypothetical protein [Acinetobacter pittii]|uniref:hypothetical protein n=1 Tax=Acinetobacter pittii TaxID=48296 RepID=UPI0008397735|nr:hypothetical protein [Acinetobacter pittii]OCY54910.1 hypothetical protein BFR81_00265 [Acinetobacter pittii]